MLKYNTDNNFQKILVVDEQLSNVALGFEGNFFGASRCYKSYVAPVYLIIKLIRPSVHLCACPSVCVSFCLSILTTRSSVRPAVHNNDTAESEDLDMMSIIMLANLEARSGRV